MVNLIDLYRLAERKDHNIYWFSFYDERVASVSVQDSYGYCEIAIDPTKITCESDEKLKLAHELGHCETGSFYNRWATCDIREKHELRADRWAIKKLLPKEELYAAIKDQRYRCKIAEIFSVPESLVEKALEYYTQETG